ncbi:hypothetical protein ACCQ02_19885 [Xanthomonas sp. NCPPB 4468]|uniref:hypothetical protein n=1 Tax=unclassified Xanthomonas TaxID=2643310 RepID=UPI00355675EF
MRAPSSTPWPSKYLISQEEMWGNLRVGIISSGEPEGRSIVYYTPMQQVLHELYSYTLAPADLPTAAGDDNPLSPSGENAGWELAPADG